jgi:hypothetical protein
MENNQLFKGEDPDPRDLSKKPITNQEAEEFENPSTDPGFEPSYTEPPLEDEGAEEYHEDDLDDQDPDII